MVKDINGLGGFSSPPTVTEQGSQAKTANKSLPATQSTTASTSEDSVQLSTEAKTLQSLADKVNSLPEVNLERAEKIKAALENGQYQVDDLVLADKILNTDAFFA